MSVETENDAEIARLLSEEYAHEYDTSKRSRLCSPISAKRFKVDHIKHKFDTSSSNQNSYCIKFDEDEEMAFILQIEEIVLSENKINETTIKVTDIQLEKTHADMTKALQPTEESNLMGRIFGMFATIQTRYVNCQTKNQILIDQFQKLSMELYPTLISLKTAGKVGIPKAAVPTLAVGLITNVLQGKLEINDAKQIMSNMWQIWNESAVWYEFFEQLVYILVAVTVPSFAQGAIGKIMGKISSSK